MSKTDLKEQVSHVLLKIGSYLEADHGFLSLMPKKNLGMQTVIQWCAEGVAESDFTDLDILTFPWLVEEIQQKQVVFIDSAEILPPQAAGFRDFLQAHRIKSLLIIPLFLDGQLTGIFRLSSTRQQISYTPGDIKLLGLIGEMVANLLERSHTETALHESEMRYQDLFNHIPLGIFRVNRNGDFIDANPSLIEQLGFPDRNTLLGTPAENCFACPGEVDRLVSMIEERGELNKHPMELRRFDGSTFWGELNTRMVHYENYEAAYIEGVVLDITKRVRFDSQMKRQLEELVVLNVVAGIGAEATNEEDLLAQSALQVGKSLYPNNFSILILSPEQGTLHGYLSEGHDGEVWVKPVETRLGRGIVGLVAIDGQPRRIPDTRQSAQYVEVNPNTQSELCVAMQSEGKILGVINLESPHQDGLSEEDLRLITVISRQLATAISKVRLLNVERKQRREAETLSKATASLVSSLDTNKVMHNILTYLAQVIHSDLTMAIMLEGSWMRAAASLGSPQFKEIRNIALLKENTPYAQILRTHKPQIFSDLAKETMEDAFLGSQQEGSWMGVPLTIRGRVEGFLTLYNCQPGIYSKAELALVQAFANQAAAAMENARLFEQTHRRVHEMESVMQVSAALRLTETTQEMFPILIEQIHSIINADTVCLFLYENKKLSLVGATYQCSEMVGHQYPLDEKNDPFREVIDSRQPLEVSTEEVHTLYKNANLFKMMVNGMDHIAIIPMMSTSQVNGVFAIGFSDSQHTLSRGNWRMLLAVAEVAGNALRRASVMETLEQRVVERTHHLATLYDISELASQSLELTVVLERSLDKILEVMVSWIGAIHLLDQKRLILTLAVQRGFSGEGLKAIHEIPLTGGQWDGEWILNNPEPLVTSDLHENRYIPEELRMAGASALISVPITAKGQTFGLLSILGETMETFSVEDVGFMATIAEQIGNAMESARLRKQAEEIAVMEERQRLARELHDSVTQALYSITLLANAAQKQAANQKWDRANLYVKELGDSAQQALKEMRLLIYELRPSALENEGLSEALFQRLESVERRAGIHTQFHLDPPLDMPTAVEEGLYRVGIEALNNILKHASATLVIVNLWAEHNQLILEIEDNGVGFNPEITETQGGIGLKSMLERVQKLGGTLTISSSPGKGTVIQAAVPLTEKTGMESSGGRNV